MEYRTEKDSMGEVRIPKHVYYGAQTERSRNNFKIGLEKIPLDLIYAYGILKKAAAIVNFELADLSAKKRDVIVEVCNEIISGQLDHSFPLSVWQTGSGTQTNMNLNEVISNRALEKMGEKLGSKDPIHPNDDVNRSQSSNDSFPTAMHIAATRLIHHKLLPSIKNLRNVFEEKSQEFMNVVKIGRTHLMDATPITLGQEFSGYVSQIDHAVEVIQGALSHLYQIALGGTAVGTGINTPKGYAKRVAQVIAEETELPFISAANKFGALAAHDAVVNASGAMRGLACALFKIANDVRLLASGPRCAIGEIIIPSNEPGSSIMPGKVNPTQCEAVTMVAAQVIGNDTTIAFAGSQGHFELNVFKPVMIYNLLQSIQLLADGAMSFCDHCVSGIKPNYKRIEENLNNSLMLATILNRKIGYDQASQVVKKAYEEDKTLKEVVLELNMLSEKEFDAYVDPNKMVNLDHISSSS